MLYNRPFGVAVKKIAVGEVGLEFDSRSVKCDTVSPIARHHCDVSSVVCCLGAMSRRMIDLLLVTLCVVSREQ